MTTCKIAWEPETRHGSTGDGYRIMIVSAPVSGKAMLRITPPRGEGLFQVCPSAQNAESHAETEIQHHRRRGEWT